MGWVAIVSGGVTRTSACICPLWHLLKCTQSPIWFTDVADFHSDALCGIWIQFYIINPGHAPILVAPLVTVKDTFSLITSTSLSVSQLTSTTQLSWRHKKYKQLSHEAKWKTFVCCLGYIDLSFVSPSRRPHSQVLQPSWGFIAPLPRT